HGIHTPAVDRRAPRRGVLDVCGVRCPGPLSLLPKGRHADHLLHCRAGLTRAPVIAHILSNLPLPVQRPLALLIFGGGLVVFFVRRSASRITGGVAAICAVGALVASWVVSPALLVPAPYALRIVSPASGAAVGAPFTLT